MTILEGTSWSRTYWLQTIEYSADLLPYPAMLLHKRLDDGEHKEDWRVRILPLILDQ